MNLTVAGISLAMQAPYPLTLGASDTYYEAFCSGGSLSDKAIGVDVAVATEHPAPCGDILFDGGGAWSLHRNGDERSYLQMGAKKGDIHISARFRNTHDSPDPVELHICPALLREGAIELPVRYPLDQVLLMYALAHRNGILLHAAGVVIGGIAYVFPGVSGAGKSTLSRLFASHGNEHVILSDDRIAIRRDGETFAAWGTPWPGEAGIARNEGFPLGGLCFLAKGEDNSLSPLDTSGAARRLMPVASVPWYDSEVLTPSLETLDALASSTPSWVFTFRPGGSTVSFLETNLHG